VTGTDVVASFDMLTLLAATATAIILLVMWKGVTGLDANG
jgi:hypothetical protein